MTREEKLAGLAYRLDEIYADNPSAAQPVVESSQPALYTPQTMKASQTNRPPAAQTVQQSAAVAEYKQDAEENPTLGQRLVNIFKGATGSSAASYTDALRANYESGQGGRTQRMMTDLRDIEWGLAQAMYAQGQDAANPANANAVAEWQRKLDAYATTLGDGARDMAMAEVNDAVAKMGSGTADLAELYRSLAAFDVANLNGVQQKATTATAEMADTMQETASQHIADAKQGLGKAGQTAVDFGVAATQLLGDKVVGKLLGPAAAKTMLASRAFGSGTAKARQEGKALGTQIGLGASTAALELTLERLFDGLAGVYGKGAADEIVEELVSKWGKSAGAQNALRILFGFAGESVEEGLSAVANPKLEVLWFGEEWGDRKASLNEILHDALIGGLLGAGSTGAKVATDSAKSAIGSRLAPSSDGEALNGDEATTVTPQVENGAEGEIQPHSDGAYAPTDPLAAIVSAAQEGRVTNRQVRTVALSPEDLQRLGIDTNGKTASQIRAAVRAALDARAAADRAPTNDGFLDEADGRVESDSGVVEQPAVVGATQQPTSASTAQESAQPNPESSVGAAERGFSPYSSLELEYGVHESGEHPVRSDDVPISTNGTDRVSQSVVTMKGAEAIPDSRIETIEQAVVDGKFSHIPIPNNEVSRRARDSIRSKGFDRALQDFFVDVRNGKAGAMLTATGAHLLNNAANSNMSGADFIELATAYAQLLRNSAQGTQASRILKQLTPEARLYQINREITRYNDENVVESLRGEIASREGIKLDEDLVDRFLDAETEEQRDAILEEMKRDIGRQMKASGMDKFTALRYTNMLGNFRTNVRNLGGNLGMMGLRVVQNGIATGLERLAGTERTRSLVVSKEYMDVGRSDFDANKREAMGEAKYTARSEAQGIMRDAREHMRVFTSRGLGTGLEAYYKGTQWLMNNKFFGDEAFARHAYARALAGYLKAQGITAEQFGSEEWQNEHTEAADKARAFAVNEAQEATFRDNTALAEAMVKLRIYGNSPVSKALNVMMDGLMPFRKTPANVFVRAMEYSPVSIGKTVLDAARKAASNTALADREGALGNFVRSGGDISGAAIVNELAKGLTGTGLVALGMLLRAGGYLRGKDDDEKRATLDELDGHQDYSLEMPDGTSLTVDWLTPASMPLFMGAELMDIVSANGVEAKGVADALMGIADPMLEMSMMQGIDDALKDIRYTEGNSVLQMAANLALDYMFQGVTNTLFGQLERTVTGESTTNYVDKDSAIPAWLQKEIGAASRKAPGDYNQIPYIDEWGQVEETGDVMTRAVNNLFNPGYVSRIENDAVNKELRRLYDKTGEGGVVPSRAEKSFTVGGEQRNLTAEEYVKYATTLGQTRYRYMQEAINSSYYKSLSDDAKASYIGDLYSYANYKAKREIEPKYDNTTYAKVAQAEAAGVSPLQYFKMKDAADADGNGSISQAEAKPYLDSQTELSNKQRDVLWSIINSSWKTNPYR